MRETRYASVGKAVLIRMIGLQENYKDTKMLDRKKSGCFSCPHFGESLKNPECSHCAACRSKTYSSSYINENNRYGYQPPQSLCAMKLFLYLHFCSVTGSGVIEDVSISALSEKIGISQRNIHYCLKHLERDEYIAYGRNGYGPGHYSVILKDYENYFKKANEGGRGYLTLSLDCLKKLLLSHSVNQMRLYLRLYVNIDDRKALPFTRETFLSDSRNTRELSRYFPAYFKQGKVLRLLDIKTDLFSFSEQDGQVSYTLRQEFFGDLSKQEYKNECYSSLKSYVEDANLQIKRYMAYEATADTIPKELIQQAIHARMSGSACFIGVEDHDLQDLAAIATQYGYDITFSTLKQLWASNPLASLKNHYGEYTRYLIEGQPNAA